MTYYNTDTCDRIREDGTRCGNDFHGKALTEKDRNGNWTGNWICSQCYLKKRGSKKRHDEYRSRYLTDRYFSKRRDIKEDKHLYLQSYSKRPTLVRTISY